MRLVGELARRKVLKVGAAYLAMAWVLLQLTDIIAPALQLPDWTMRLVLLLLAIGFPVAVLLAWQFNFTGQGLQPETGGAHVQRARTRDWVLLAVIALLGVGVGVVAQRMLGGGSAAPATPAPVATKPGVAAREDPSVAVLPFLSMSGAAEDGYFADGLSEEILNSLANIPGLKVAGRTSSFSYKGHDEDLRKIARELGVAHIIEGSVRREGTRLRVTAQLVEATKGFHIWSQTYDRTLDDTLAIQTEIANAVADKLRLSVLPAGDGKVQLDADAQQAYLKAIGLIGEGSTESLQQAVALLRPLQRAHPEFLPAYLPLADSVQRLGWFGEISMPVAFAEMRDLSQQATQHARESLDARVLAALIPFAANDLAPSYRGYERVLAQHRTLADAAPNHPLLQLNTSDAARLLDDPETALRYAERYVALEPRDPKGHVAIARIMASTGRLPEAIASGQRALALSPRNEEAWFEVVRLQARTGQYAKALETVEQCQRAGAKGCTDTLTDMYEFLRKPALEKRAASDAWSLQAPYQAFLDARRRGGYQGAMAWLGEQGGHADEYRNAFGAGLVTAALESGENAAVLSLSREFNPGLFETASPILSGQMSAANEVAVALHRLGRDDEARSYFRRVLETHRRLPDGYQPRSAELPHVVALAWLGRIDEAVAETRSEIGKGWRFEYYLTETLVGKPDPLAEPLVARPEFMALMRQVRERNAADFARLADSGRDLVPQAPSRDALH